MLDNERRTPVPRLPRLIASEINNKSFSLGSRIAAGD